MLDETGRCRPILIQPTGNNNNNTSAIDNNNNSSANEGLSLVQKLKINEYLYMAQQDSRNCVKLLIEKISHLLEALHEARRGATQYMADFGNK